LQAGGRGFESRHVHQLYFFQRNSVDVFSAYHLLLKQVVRGFHHYYLFTSPMTYAAFSITDSPAFPGALGATPDSASRTTVTIK
jgi:hypothetical protein